VVFLYLGLRAVPPLLDVGTIETASKSDILSALLPIVFNLAVAWWLLGGSLVRRAYPETPKFSDYPRPSAQRGASPAQATPSPGMPEMDKVETRLASLVEKPKADPEVQPRAGLNA
jgi:hypothetical protein